MGIFSTVSEVIKNKTNFKLWEEKQKLEQAQRQKLYEQNQYSEEEIEKARALGETIIDAIDVMDNHSESVAENVETATEPLVGIAPFLGTTAASIASAKFIADPAFNKLQEVYSKEMNTDLAKDLYKRILKDKAFEKKGLSEPFLPLLKFFNPINKGDVKRIKDSALRKEAETFMKNYAKKTAKYKSSFWLTAGLTVGAFFASFIGAIIAATKIQVNSSKVARFQAREQLKDPKSFVSYTPEQIAQAKLDMEADKAEKAKNKKLYKKTHKEEKQPKLKQGFWGSLASIIKDNKAYRQAKKNDKIQPKLVERELSQDELIQAEKDKEVIQRTVRLINNEAEKNSENMETAANVFIVGTPILGATVGGGASWVLNKTGIVDKSIQKVIDKNASEYTKGLLEEYNNFIKKEPPKGIVKKMLHRFEKQERYGNYVRSLISDLESNTFENGIRRAPKLSEQIKHYMTAAMTNSAVRNKIIAVASAFVTSIAGLIIALKLQKSAARAGRYNAKRDLEKDPRNFIGYTQDEYNSVKDATPVKTESKFKETLLFIPRVMKQYVAYNKYKKHEFKQEQELRKYLHKQDVSAEQLKDAKNLQRKIFNTFERVDDNSQKYSESMEAAIDIAQPFVIYAGYIAAMTPIILALLGLAKVKDNPAKVIEKVTKWMSKGSKGLNSKLTKRYLNGVARNVPNKTAEIELAHKPIAHILKGVDLKNDKTFDIINKMVKNLKLSPEELRKLPAEEINTRFNQAVEYIENLSTKLNLEEMAGRPVNIIEMFGLKEFVAKLQAMPASQKIDTLEAFLNPKNISLPNGAKTAEQEMFEELIKMLKQFAENKPKDLFNFIPDFLKDPEKLLGSLKQVVKNGTDDSIQKLIEKTPVLKNIPDLNRETLINILENLEKSVKNVPKEELKNIMNSLVNEFNKNPDEFIKIVRNGNIKTIFMTPELQNTLVIAGVSIPALSIALTYAVEAWLANLELRAGRLGVMKSLEELEDNRYYANIEE